MLSAVSHESGRLARNQAALLCAQGSSSPRPWGTPLQLVNGRFGVRFIPTPVGNTQHPDGLRHAQPVHPHARGEHFAAASSSSRSVGSSPRPWGTQVRSVGLGLCVRFIPTPVGNTSRTPHRPARGPVHPHARGEHCASRSALSAVAGSSPRRWGTRAARDPGRLPVRFIPTPVGNTAEPPPTVRCAPVHPHARGEHLVSTKHRFASAGSSPRPWGTRLPMQLGLGEIRFIPTPVGNTSCRPPSCVMRWVHPHARGEHAGFPNYPNSYTGSSPRPWGTRALPSRHRDHVRFIPTPVGNTS